MSLAKLTRPIATFLEAAEKREISALLSLFTANAVVTEGGQEYRGDAIPRWGDRLSFTAIRPINIARRGGKTVLTVIAREGGEREPKQLDWTFEIVGEGISALIIDPSPLPHLPAPVAAYVRAANAFDLERLLAAFADDAVVNDQLYEYRGREEIKDWASRDIVGEHVTMYVVKAVEHYGHAIVTANVDGDYDKRGLPDPLALTFYFSVSGGKIVQLIVLRNEPRF